jgi:uncharacterized protein
MKSIIIAGGTGLVGSRLTELLLEKGYPLIILSRDKNKRSNIEQVKYAFWDVERQSIDKTIFNDATAVVNLAGESVANKRWTIKQKQIITDSRINAAKTLVKAIEENKNRIETVINASAIGWYKPIEEYSKVAYKYQEELEANDDFLGITCKKWEDSISLVKQQNKRLVILRIGIVLSKNGGALAEFLKPIKMGVAAILGNQKISWIHIDDLCKLIIEAIENKSYEGVYNAVAPEVTTNKELNIALAKAIRGKFFIPFPVPNFIIKLMLGEMSEEVLKSSNISSKKLEDNGYNFMFKNMKHAVKDLCK